MKTFLLASSTSSLGLLLLLQSSFLLLNNSSGGGGGGGGGVDAFHSKVRLQRRSVFRTTTTTTTTTTSLVETTPIRRRTSSTITPLYMSAAENEVETTTSTSTSTSTTASGSSSSSSSSSLLPELSKHGIYQIQSEEDYANLLKANPNQLVVMKYFAGYCRACKGLEPKFIAIKEDKQLMNLPIVWAEYESKRSNKEFFQKLGVLTLPTIHFYDGSRGLVENFPCGPSKVALLKRKLAQFLNARVDPETLQLKEWDVSDAQVTSSDGTTTTTTAAAAAAAAQQVQTEPRVQRQVTIENEFITAEHIDYLRNGIPFFQDVTDEEFEELLSKAKLLTFDAGDVIIRQGMPPQAFYVIKSGVAEMSIKSKFDDPIKTPPYYLGAVVNELQKFDYFGERALTTGEPYAASVRVVEKVRCFAFQAQDIPASSILSQKRKATADMVDQLSQRYVLPKDYTPNYLPVTPRDECVLELLVRFKQIRQAAKCFQYIMQSEPTWGDFGEIARRSMLVSKLSESQKQEFSQVFDIVDVSNKGKISLLEMRKFMASARVVKSKSTVDDDEQLLEMMARANPMYYQDQQQQKNIFKDYAISKDEFMGVMAEAEFYTLFTETFQELDKDNTGYVRAGDLDDVLGGVRDLISNDRNSIIDVEDKDMLVDYEQFSKMLLGAAL